MERLNETVSFVNILIETTNLYVLAFSLLEKLNFLYEI